MTTIAITISPPLREAVAAGAAIEAVIEAAVIVAIKTDVAAPTTKGMQLLKRRGFNQVMLVPKCEPFIQIHIQTQKILL